MVQRTTTYSEQGRAFLAHARGELAKGDLQQASEKGWGAAALMVKAIAQERGWHHRSHRSLQRAIGSLDLETDDPDWIALFSAAESLHQNFYENWSTVRVINRRLRLVEQFVEKAEGLLGAER